MAQDHPENQAGDRVVQSPDGPPHPQNHQDSDSPKPDDHDQPPHHHYWRWLIIGGVALVLIAGGLLYFRTSLVRFFTTESTDDAQVNGHVSAISTRVAGTVLKVYVDDNQRVQEGDLLLEIDHEPYQVAVDQKRAALAVAEANLLAAMAQVRGQEASARASWFSLVGAQEQVRYQITTLHSDVANLRLQEANLELARKETTRTRLLVDKSAAPQEQLDQQVAAEEVARQRVTTAKETIRRDRAALGLPPNDKNPTDVPENLEQNFSAVQTALSNSASALAQIGLPVQLHHLTPDKLLNQLTAVDPAGDFNQALDLLIEKAPAVIQARAARDQAREELRNAELNLRYSYVYAPIDGQISRRSANPGNNVTTGQALMAVRSLTDIWIDANFKETQLKYVRIGQPVDVYVDAYPHKVFRGRVQGFSAGTGASLALIPPENATGNYVKIVQRLPVRVELDPADLSDDTPLFVGLSARPYVKYQEQPTGPNAGRRLRETIPSDELRPTVPPPPVPSDRTRTTSPAVKHTEARER